MTKKQEEMYYALLELTTEQAVNAILDWCGTQILDDAFMQHLIDEGYMEDEDEDEEIV